MYKRPIWIILSCIAVLITIFMSSCSTGYPLGIKDKPIKKAINYLYGAQSPDGSIGSYSDTAWSIMALSASGNNPEAFEPPSPVDYLSQNNDQLIESFNFTADLARNILAIIAAGKNPESFGNGNMVVPEGDYISALIALHDGQQFGAIESLNEDFWAILALVAAGYTQEDEIISTTASYIIENQGPDLGWSWATPNNEWYYDSDPDNTAAAIMALVRAGVRSDNPLIKNAIEYLKTTQGDAGGFVSYGLENTGSTAWVMAALSIVGEDPSAWVKNGYSPVNYLLSMQDEDGSFSFASPLPEGYLAMPEKTTADSIVALLGCGYPVHSSCTANWWLWIILVMLIASMITFLSLNARKRWK